MKKTIILCLFIFFLAAFYGEAQEIIPLYRGTLPNSKSGMPDSLEFEGSRGMIRKVYVPSLELYLPEEGKASGSAVIICPGGGYSVIVFQGEGVTSARELANHGIAAFVLKYRLPDESLEVDKKIAPLQDAQQAIKIIRENASQWGIDPGKIGIMGFSAGGHLASSAATHFKTALIENHENTSLRPDFQILVYPVISMRDNLTHRDSRKQLLGSEPTKEELDFFSNELHINEESPPAYLTHTADDTTVDVDNSIEYFEQLRKHKVPVEMHIYPEGGHGFIFRRQGWMIPLFDWMKSQKLILD